MDEGWSFLTELLVTTDKNTATNKLMLFMLFKLATTIVPIAMVKNKKRGTQPNPK